jgi:hypothetical protein
MRFTDEAKIGMFGGCILIGVATGLFVGQVLTCIIASIGVGLLLVSGISILVKSG